MEENHTFVSNSFTTAYEKASQSFLWTRTKMNKVCGSILEKKLGERRKKSLMD